MLIVDFKGTKWRYRKYCLDKDKLNGTPANTAYV